MYTSFLLLSTGLYMFCAQSPSCVQLFVAQWTIAHQTPLSLAFFRARILEWVAMPSSRGCSRPRDWTHDSCVSCVGRCILFHWSHWEIIRLTDKMWLGGCVWIWERDTIQEKEPASYPKAFIPSHWTKFRS